MSGRPRIRLLADSGALAALCVLDLMVSFNPQHPGAHSTTTTAAYAAAGYLLLIVRRSRPGPVFAGMLTHLLLAAVLAPGYLPTFGLWLALSTIALRSRLRWALVGLVAMTAYVGLTVADELQRHPGSDRAAAVTGAVVLSSGICLALFGVGRWARWSVIQRELAARHAAAETVAAERRRISRELHDLVAHAVTLMILQTGGAAKVLRADPERAETALGHVDRLGQQALVELRRLLAIIAPDESGAPSTPPARPGLDALAGLIEQVGVGGVPVQLAVRGQPVALEPGVDVCVYRVVQEALTNAARYADLSRPVHVDVHWRTSEVSIRIENHVRRLSARPLSSGRGLVGIRERVRAAGGRVEVGSAGGGLFRVEARLPVREPAPAGVHVGGAR